MADEFDDPEFDRLGSSVLDQVTKAYPKQPVPQKQVRPGFNAILVNARQKGNPVLNGIKVVPWEYGDIQPDFVIGATACALFLSLKYHRLHPEYIYNRIRDLGKQYGLRVLLVLCDIDNHSDSIRELTKTSVVNNLALILAWSHPEAGRYLESFKSLETAPAKEIKGQQSTNYSDQLVDVLTSIRAINKTDAYNLIGTFGSLKRALDATPEELTAIAGWGPQKVKNYLNAINLPFSTKTGTSSQRQEQILLQATKLARSEFNGDFGPGVDHSASRTEATSNGANLGNLGVDAPETSGLSMNHDTIINETAAAGPLAAENDTEDRDNNNARQRKVNPEFQGTLDILAKMREASGYGATTNDS